MIYKNMPFATVANAKKVALALWKRDPKLIVFNKLNPDKLRAGQRTKLYYINEEVVIVEPHEGMVLEMMHDLSRKRFTTLTTDFVLRNAEEQNLVRTATTEALGVLVEKQYISVTEKFDTLGVRQRIYKCFKRVSLEMPYIKWLSVMHSGEQWEG